MSRKLVILVVGTLSIGWPAAAGQGSPSAKGTLMAWSRLEVDAGSKNDRSVGERRPSREVAR